MPNGYKRLEMLSIENDDVVIDGTISFRGEDDFTYILNYAFDQSGYNITIEKRATWRTPPTVLKSLTG